MTYRTLITSAIASATLAAVAPASAEDGHHFEYERQKWSFGGVLGQYDKAQLQRGFQVYKEVCSSCHGMSRIYFRNLVQPGGPEFPEAAVKELAASWPNKPLAGPNDDGMIVDKKGNLLTRPALLSDTILGPYRNDKEAKAAQNGAIPPDLSIMAKARDLHNGGFWANHVVAMGKDIAAGYQEGGPDYIYNLLVSYPKDEKDIPKGFKVADGLNYNKAYPGNQIAMVPPLSKENFIKYQDGKGSLEENARDVSAFLAWAADPALNQRKAMGWQVMLYLLITSVLLYLGKKRVWARIGGH
jgi:ubiquinol-cytochrome c reductase cytochrome c1 subunit